jgi:ATP-dependent Clp protease adapter protein ClpS
MMMQRLK